MSLVRAIFFVLALSVIFIGSSCVEDKDYGEANTLRPNVNRDVESNTNQKVAEDNEEKLDSLVNLPFEPIENVFREEPVVSNTNTAVSPEPGEKRLMIVLRFSTEDTASLIKRASSQGEPYQTSVDPEPWFPVELIAKSGTSGNEQLKGTGYSAKDFVKAPWLNGSLVKINDTEYFVLQLRVKK